MGAVGDLLALGGFFGNFVLSLTDHAANGFFARTEWIPVISSAFATGFLLVPLSSPVTRRFLDLSAWWSCCRLLSVYWASGFICTPT